MTHHPTPTEALKLIREALEVATTPLPEDRQKVVKALAALPALEAGQMGVDGRRPIETAPKGVPVIVAGGIAMHKTGGEWFTGMETPMYQRPLQWQPKWWMPIPTDNDFPNPTPDRETLVEEMALALYEKFHGEDTRKNWSLETYFTQRNWHDMAEAALAVCEKWGK